MLKDNGFRAAIRRPGLDAKLVGYFSAAGGITALCTHEAQSAIVGNSTVQPFGINGEVNIDFNNDTQIDFQIDHDRYNLNGTNLDYLQIDKNDINGETNPLDTDPYFFTTFPKTTLHYTPFPLNQSSHRNDDAMVLSFTTAEFGDKGGYVIGLEEGAMIGGMGNDYASLIPGAIWDWQEGADCFGTDSYCRANRLIDEDHGQIDAAAGRQVTYPTIAPFGPQPEFPDLDDFTGLTPTDVRYVGVRVDLNDAGYSNDISNANAASGDDPANYWYGWIGIRITNEADATGEVVGYAYESVKGMPIAAGALPEPPAGLPGDYNNDSVVNAADYTVWRNNLGTNFNLNGNGDETGGSLGTVDQADYNWWKQHYGDSVPGSGAGGITSVPEPGSLLMAAIGGCLLITGFVMKRFRNGRT